MLPLRWHLVLLVAGTLLPVVIFAAAVVNQLAQQQRAAAERRLVRAARSLADAIDREQTGAVRMLQALAQSDALGHDDLRTFYGEARRVATMQPEWLCIILALPDGSQRLNTLHPYGAPLPHVIEPASLKRLVATAQPQIGDLARGGARWAFPIRVPVMRRGRVRYSLTAVITPESLNKLVAAQAPTEGEWSRGVVDGQGKIAARSQNIGKYLGEPAAPAFLRVRETAYEGFYRTVSLDGMPVYSAFSHVDTTRWTAGVGVPVDVLEAPARRAMLLVALLGLGLLLVSGTGALLLSRRIAGAMTSASAAAVALARGESSPVQHAGIEEAAALETALRSSAKLLAQREAERDLHLARAETARAQAEEASRLKDEFLATLSHELRTPLTAIMGWANLARLGRGDADQLDKALETIERNSQSLAGLVDDLLDMARIVTGKLQLAMQPLGLEGVIGAAVDAVRPAAAAKGITLQVHRDAEVTVAGDATRLQQVVWNLLTNAVKFTPRGGQVAVKLTRDDGQAAIEVQDSGIGIGPEFLPHVFDRFRQADGSSTRQFGGLGLGLAIVRHLVELHGGTVEVASEGANEGTTFTVRLPLAPAAPVAATGKHGGGDSDGAAAAQSLQGVRVLLVDDDPDARSLITAMLAQNGAEVRACASAAEAFQEVTAWRPAVIVSDIGMPQQDGYEFMRMVREWEATAGGTIPAAALTAYARKEDRIKALTSGYQVHIAKPVEPAELTAAVSRLLDGGE